MEIKQHRPGCVDMDDEPITESFSTTKELLNIPFVKSFGSNPGFHQYSIADPVDDPSLMAEYNKGQKWWVIGHLKNIDTILDLPNWVSPPREDK